MRLFKAGFFPIFFFLFSACSDIIEYSPFDSDVSTQNINTDHINRIIALPAMDTLKFAVFSDVHEDYDAMIDALKDINHRKEAAFVIVNGDVTNAALSQEFEWYASAIPSSDVPVVTVIGNHDCLANGLLIFKRMFGPYNTSFVTGDYKLILFNNIIWENNLTSPDYEWLGEELASEYHNIILSHMPPIASDIGALHRIVYNSIADSTNTKMAIHSSAHRYSEYKYNGIPSLITTTIRDREYYLIKAFNGEFKVTRMNF